MKGYLIQNYDSSLLNALRAFQKPVIYASLNAMQAGAILHAWRPVIWLSDVLPHHYAHAWGHAQTHALTVSYHSVIILPDSIPSAMHRLSRSV